MLKSMGRPAKFDLEKFRELIGKGTTIADAARACGVAPSGIHNLVNRRGWRIVHDVRLEAIEGSNESAEGKSGTGEGAAPARGSEGQQP
jgi:hypothetical protein